MRQAICTVLASVMVLEPMLLARAAAESGLQPQEKSEQKLTLKEKVLKIPPQSYVEVRLLDKSKLRGRLGEVTDEGFALQAAQGDKIQNVKVSFDQVKSVKVVEQKGAKVGRGFLYALAGVGALFVVLLIWASSVSD